MDVLYYGTPDYASLTTLASQVKEKPLLGDDKDSLWSMSFEAQSSTAFSHSAEPNFKHRYLTIPTALESVWSRPQISPLVPISRVIGYGGVADRFRIRCRLLRISWSIRKHQHLPQEFYQDLVEVQRSDKDIYTCVERCVARSLLRSLALRNHVHAIAAALLKFPPHVSIALIRSLVSHDTMKIIHSPSAYCSIVYILQVELPDFFRDELALDDFCSIIIQTPHSSNLEHISLFLFFDGIAKSSQASLPADPFARVTDPGSHDDHSSWDLPLSAQCLLQYLIGGRSDSIHAVIEHVMTSILAFAEKFPTAKATQHVVQYHPHLLKGDFHPARPFVLFAIHLAYHSKSAAEILIKQGILNAIGRLWVYDFYDPRGARLRDIISQNDMRVGCLLLLGALARHFPTAREMSDHLLMQMVELNGSKATSVMSLGGYVNTCHCKAPLDGLRNPRSAMPCAVSSLTLFFMESCVASGVRIPRVMSQKPSEPWTAVMDILCSFPTSEEGMSTKHAAARILFALASLPDNHWQGFTELLCTPSVTSYAAAFKFLCRTFLLASSDPSAMPKDTVDVLRKLYLAAKTRRSEIVNPVDRFIMLIRVRQATNRTQFSNMLALSGMPDLLNAALDGKYDFLGDEPPTGMQVLSREQVCLRMSKELRFTTRYEEESWRQRLASTVPTSTTSSIISASTISGSSKQ